MNKTISLSPGSTLNLNVTISDFIPRNIFLKANQIHQQRPYFNLREESLLNTIFNISNKTIEFFHFYQNFYFDL